MRPKSGLGGGKGVPEHQRAEENGAASKVYSRNSTISQLDSRYPIQGRIVQGILRIEGSKIGENGIWCRTRVTPPLTLFTGVGSVDGFGNVGDHDARLLIGLEKIEAGLPGKCVKFPHPQWSVRAVVHCGLPILKEDLAMKNIARIIKNIFRNTVKFGGCKMCSCTSYHTSENDWQTCDCGHSRSMHQH